MLEHAFSLASTAAMLAWLMLIASLFTPPRLHAPLRRVAGRVVPGLLALGYVACLLVWWRGAPGGFDSLAAVAALFGVPGLLLAGWMHYLAFDLLVGRWQVDDAAQRGVHGSKAWWLVPCLLLTFLFGPAGWLAYAAARRVLLPPDATGGGGR
jgi:hypothetical protein